MCFNTGDDTVLSILADIVANHPDIEWIAKKRVKVLMIVFYILCLVLLIIQWTSMSKDIASKGSKSGAQVPKSTCNQGNLNAAYNRKNNLMIKISK